MTSAPLSDEDHVSRYCKPSTVDDGSPLAAAFTLRDGEPYLSVNWLEFFGEKNQKAAIDNVRNAFARKGFGVRPNGLFAVLNVDAAKSAAFECSQMDLCINHMPYSDDPSHSGISGYSSDELLVAVTFASLITLGDVHPAVT